MEEGDNEEHAGRLGLAPFKRSKLALFSRSVPVVNEKPMFEFIPLQPISGRIEFKGNKRKIKKKVSELFDKGALVDFAPGEAMITGSKLFEEFNRLGGSMQWAFTVQATLSLVCTNKDGRELSRLDEMPGQITGGQKECRLASRLEHAPLAIDIGPMPATRIPAKIKIEPASWNGQRLLHLAHFERLFQFFKEFCGTSETLAEGRIHGNLLFSGRLPLHKIPFVPAFVRFLTLIYKARKVAGKCGINPSWSLAAFDSDAQDTAEQLYGIFFEKGWQEKMPNVTQEVVGIKNKSFSYDVLRQAENPGFVRLVSDCSFKFLGEKIDAGRLTQIYSDVTISLKRRERNAAIRKVRHKPKTLTKARRRGAESVDLILTGSPNTVLTVRQAEPGE